MKRMLSILAALLLLASAIDCSSQQPATVRVHPASRHISNLTDSGHYYEKTGDKKMAMQYHKQALAESQQFHLQEHEARTLANIGRLLSNENGDESLQYLFSALAIARTIGHHTLEADISGSITAVYKQQENYKEALAALEQHKKFADTLLAINHRKEVEQLKAAENRKLEQTVGLTVILAILLLAAIFAFYFRKTRRLNRQLKQSIHVRDKLFSILAHDLRGPANNVVQVLELLDEGDLSETEVKEVLTMLKKQALSLNETLDSLLHWSKAQLNGIQVSNSHFNPAILIDKNLALLQGQMQQKNIVYSGQIPADLSVHGDPDHFDLVIRNLLSNAIKFSHASGAIEIAVIEKPQEIVFSVTDHGVGISPENQHNFAVHQIETSFGTAGEKGTGLGLPLVKDFVQANKGRIWLESEPGKGTTFYFSFPASR